ncbi:MAG: GMC family oxidoreductase N-terminal domain-containing protein [Reyranellaceae bacterium]
MEVLPYFRKLGERRFPRRRLSRQRRPNSVYRRRPRGVGPCRPCADEAALALGYDWCADHNALDGGGVSPYAINSRQGLRISTNDGYLERRGRTNLTIVDRRWSTLQVEGNRAHVSGVSVQVGGERRSVRARREVILSAGAIHSPAILQRSGIGRARCWTV